MIFVHYIMTFVRGIMTFVRGITTLSLRVLLSRATTIIPRNEIHSNSLLFEWILIYSIILICVYYKIMTHLKMHSKITLFECEVTYCNVPPIVVPGFTIYPWYLVIVSLPVPQSNGFQIQWKYARIEYNPLVPGNHIASGTWESYYFKYLGIVSFWVSGKIFLDTMKSRRLPWSITYCSAWMNYIPPGTW